MRPLILIPILALAAGGSACSQQITTPSGQVGHALNCGGAFRGWGSCYEQAGKMCPRGYTVLAGHGGQGQFGSVAGNAYGLGGSSAPNLAREMIVQCKA